MIQTVSFRSEIYSLSLNIPTKWLGAPYDDYQEWKDLVTDACGGCGILSITGKKVGWRDDCHTMKGMKLCIKVWKILSGNTA